MDFQASQQHAARERHADNDAEEDERYKSERPDPSDEEPVEAGAQPPLELSRYRSCGVRAPPTLQ
jgi:hypothetical protein